ncbi:MAG TPA: alpha/beta hydrolase [Acidimicrobiales bacterium]
MRHVLAPRRAHLRARRARPLALVAGLVLLLAGCDLRLLVPDGPAPLRYRDEIFTTVDVTRDVPYGSAVDQNGQQVTLLLDVYEPAGDTVDARPAIVWVHGGGFSQGSKTSPELVEQANLFARKGYLNVSITYRLWPGGCFPVTAQCVQAIVDAKHDAQAAVRYLRAHAAELGVDPDRIAIAGTSAGAITALNVAYGSDDVGDSGNPGYPSTVRGAVSLSGAALTTSPDPGEPGAPKALLFHGTADPIVPYQWAVDDVNAAKAAGLEVFLTTWEGAGHVPYVAHRDEIHTHTSNFLYWTLDAHNAAR